MSRQLGDLGPSPALAFIEAEASKSNPLAIIPKVKVKTSTGRGCAVFGCHNYQGTHAKLGIRFYKFPKDPVRNLAWSLALNKLDKDSKPWRSSKYSMVCSDHFVDGVKSNMPNLPGFMPTLFPTHSLDSDKEADITRQARMELGITEPQQKMYSAAEDPLQPEQMPLSGPKDEQVTLPQTQMEVGPTGVTFKQQQLPYAKYLFAAFKSDHLRNQDVVISDYNEELCKSNVKVACPQFLLAMKCPALGRILREIGDANEVTVVIAGFPSCTVTALYDAVYNPLCSQLDQDLIASLGLNQVINKNASNCEVINEDSDAGVEYTEKGCNNFQKTFRSGMVDQIKETTIANTSREEVMEVDNPATDKDTINKVEQIESSDTDSECQDDITDLFDTDQSNFVNKDTCADLISNRNMTSKSTKGLKLKKKMLFKISEQKFEMLGGKIKDTSSSISLLHKNLIVNPRKEPVRLPKVRRVTKDISHNLLWHDCDFRLSHIHRILANNPKRLVFDIDAELPFSSHPKLISLLLDGVRLSGFVRCQDCQGIMTTQAVQSESFNHSCDQIWNSKPANPKHTWQCGQCGKWLVNSSSLNVHVSREHIGEIQICDLCGAVLKSKAGMRIHLQRVHFGSKEKNLVCEQCGQKFREKKTLDVHMKQHTGERPQVCGICHKGFIQSQVCKKHVLTAHGIVIPKGQKIKEFFAHYFNNAANN